MKPENFSYDDFQSLIDFEKKVFPGEGWDMEYYKEALSGSPSIIKVIRENGQIVGYFYDALYQIEFPDGEKSLCGEVASIAVDEKHRGSGLAKELLKEAVLELEKMDAPRIVIFTKTNNYAMQGLARKIGFEVTGYWQNFYGSDHAFLVELKKEVKE